MEGNHFDNLTNVLIYSGSIFKVLFDQSSIQFDDIYSTKFQQHQLSGLYCEVKTLQ